MTVSHRAPALVLSVTIGLASVLTFASASAASAADLGAFFRAVGNSLAHPGQHRPATRKQGSGKDNAQSAKNNSNKPASDNTVAANAAATAAPTATAAATPAALRASAAPADSANPKNDLPYGIPVPNKQGFVTSPYAPRQGYVDVRGFPSGTHVKDPYTGKLFLTP